MPLSYGLTCRKTKIKKQTSCTLPILLVYTPYIRAFYTRPNCAKLVGNG